VVRRAGPAVPPYAHLAYVYRQSLLACTPACHR
jgi:hypothetical protein